ncbi:hypothetical protein TSOC_009402 [Tetrabaena socialis]|uniref:2OG-Fe dioxygenase family protein n=1 Tax=Tetrabaena socialis TaxID=47790 RepID=A0A2J7ZW09_9CHLO|nr:hypothetical protein TSOC_009402 [Tetrabaena socialis]|eukprot:PNH04445.1 hypothetical protein TSOC_009402 [Tetrabaena socialis]
MQKITELNPGNIRRYIARVSGSVRRDFDALTPDPYVPAGFRRKHIVRYIVLERSGDLLELGELPMRPLFQDRRHNPVHGDLHRVYPRFTPSAATRALVEGFVRTAGLERGTSVLVQAQRITCSTGQEGLPSVEDWHQDGVDGVGVCCVARENIQGGASQFKDLDGNLILSDVLRPSELLLFDDAHVKHRVTPIRVRSPGSGHRDVLLFSHGGCS